MSLGLKRGTVAVEAHKSEWEISAKKCIEDLKKILGDLALDVQHVGSTAIKSICAKPIIDIAIAVSDFDSILSMNKKLEENGFIFRGQDIPGQYLYVCGDEDTRTHHIHVVIHDSNEWNNYINMRDYLNTHEDDARAYSELKESLAKKYPDDRKTYTEKKSDLINEILNKANHWRKALYVLAGYDDETEKILSGLQNKLYDLGFSGIQTKNIPMHFTLGSYDIDFEDELKSRLEKIAESKRAFEISFTHIGLFRLPENDVLFVAPEVNKDVLSLKDNFLDSKDQFKWSAHTTLLIDKPDLIQKALPNVLNSFPEIEGKVSKLYLYEFWPTRHIMTVELN